MQISYIAMISQGIFFKNIVIIIIIIIIVIIICLGLLGQWEEEYHFEQLWVKDWAS